jgi:arylsulfatase A-like enzyme
MFPRQPQQIDSMAAVRAMFDGYDTGVLVADQYVGRIFNQLADLGVLEDTAIVVSSDHGETLGELNVYGDHQTADECTSHVPMIVKWPGLPSGERNAFHYQFDVFASLLDLAGGKPSSIWDARSFAESLARGEDTGRNHLVVSQGAWTCQRAIRFEQYLCIQTLHDGYHLYPDVMLFDLEADPHEQNDIADEAANLARRGLALLDAWHAEMLPGAARGRDPLENVVAEGGPFHTRGQLAGYLQRLRTTGRADHADRLEARHGCELVG